MVAGVALDRVDRTGQVVGGRFRIDAQIGKGAMAHVYRALDLSTSMYVAVKILRASLEDDPSAVQRFAREAEVQEQIRHHNVAALLEVGLTDEGHPFLALELLRGKTLRGVLREEHRIDVRRAVSYAWQALQGLSAVHSLGVLHRDLKPANLMLEPSRGPFDRVVLIDFGFATFEGSARLTHHGTVVGSLSYIAPERLRGDPIDHRSDLYSIGVILHEMVAGQPPFTAADDLGLIELHLHRPPPPLGPEVPRELDEIVARALAKDPHERDHDADAMAGALARAAAALR
jgi:eukaryotic-like serine/threonine-protein kinase